MGAYVMDDYRRALLGDREADDAFESVLEEANDVLAVLDVLHIPRDDWRVCQKLKRWEERLRNGNQELHDGD